tara:strand:- start:9522 stop:9923 length:402 start_codon:yes stop_codon:yes gene_type:complete
MDIKDLAKKYGLKRDDFWELHGNWILTHDAVTKIMHEEGIIIKRLESIFQSEDSSRFIVTASKVIREENGDHNFISITSVGEADRKNCRIPYLSSMAEKRGIDRCVLKLIRAYEYGIYSEVEADDFKKGDSNG